MARPAARALPILEDHAAGVQQLDLALACLFAPLRRRYIPLADPKFELLILWPRTTVVGRRLVRRRRRLLRQSKSRPDASHHDCDNNVTHKRSPSFALDANPHAETFVSPLIDILAKRLMLRRDS